MQQDIDAARSGLKEITGILESGKYDVVVLDEATIALFFNLFSLDELIEATNRKKSETELIITGRNAPDELIELADLITEMREIKHYYTKGIEAQKGIEY